MLHLSEKQRMIQEYVPGKQITLAHVIANPDPDIYIKLGLPDSMNSNAIGILTITPSEAAIIAADIASKAAEVTIGFIDRFSGSVVFTGGIAAVEAALTEVLVVLGKILGFSDTVISRT